LTSYELTIHLVHCQTTRQSVAEFERHPDNKKSPRSAGWEWLATTASASRFQRLGEITECFIATLPAGPQIHCERDSVFLTMDMSASGSAVLLSDSCSRSMYSWMSGLFFIAVPQYQ
jgi:hypothetical protein